MNDKIQILPYDYRSSKPVYHYLSCTVKTLDENYYKKLDPVSIDSKGKDKLVFGWNFGWSCKEDGTDVPYKQLQKAKRLAAKLVKDPNVIEIKIWNYFL